MKNLTFDGLTLGHNTLTLHQIVRMGCISYIDLLLAHS